MKTRLSLSNEAGRRQALKRFGYAEAPPADDAIDLEHEWRLLAPGIDPALADVPLNRLEPAKQALAIDRVRQRRELDRMMEACDQAHASIAEGGAGPDLVEAYTRLRDRFEDAVEAFMASGETLATRLRPAG
ncbi:hypothetical protein [Polaromonas sp.]|uniref:hypothetical protein n=1 Tax=Polaromonas sp. TaxID=1869339 RepID=UPI00352A06E1